jgi:MFS family permease
MSHSITADSKVILPHGDCMAWLVCLSAGLFFLYEFFQLNIFDVINQPLREDFHINAAQLSWMSSAYLLADILFLLPAGLILDRYSTRRVILVSMLLCIMGTLGFAITDSFALAFFFHFLSGIGNAFCFLSCVVLVTHWFPPRRQALVIGLLVTMAFLGGMMAHTPLAYLYDLFGWRSALLIDAAFGAILLLWIAIFVQDRPTKSSNSMIKNSYPMLPDFISALTNLQNWLAGLYTACLNLPIMVLCALWGASYLQSVHHLSEIAASNVISLIFMGSIIGCPLLGWLSDSQGRRKPLMILAAVATLITLIPLFLDVTLSQMTLRVLFFLLGFFTSAQVISYPLIAESNQAKNIGAATGIASIIIMGGGGVGQVLFGWLITQHAIIINSAYTKADFQFAMWMFPVTIIAALLSVFLIRETHCKRTEGDL